MGDVLARWEKAGRTGEAVPHVGDCEELWHGPSDGLGSMSALAPKRILQPGRTDVKIARFEILVVEIPMIRSFSTSWGTISRKEAVIVRLTTEDGLIGYGESSSFAAPLYNHETVNSCVYVQRNFIAPRVLGKNFDSPEQFRAAFADIVGNNCAKMGPECAFWHLVAQAEKTSLKQLFGGTRREIEVGESIGVEPTIDAGIKVVEEGIEHGYRRIKMKIRPGWDTEILGEVRKRWPDVELTADANCAYRSDRHLELLRSLEQYDLAFMEQPFPADDLVGHADLQRMTRTPICLDESVESLDDARTAQRLGSGKVINIKPGRLGGIVESLRVYDFAAQHGIGVWVGGIFETGIGRAFSIAFAAKQNCVYPADLSPFDRFFSHDLVHNSFRVKPNGLVDVPDEPGLGFDVHEENLARFTTETIVA